MAKGYNGYPSWNAWNVSLWINNDEYLYRIAYDTVKELGYTKGLEVLCKMWVDYTTPDGAKFNKRSIKLAIEDIL